MMGGMGAFAWVFPFIMIGFMALMIASSIVYTRRRHSDVQRRHEPTPLELLRHRYARGEIDREEYLERRVLLEEDEDHS